MSIVKQNPMWQHGYGSSFVLRSFVSLGITLFQNRGLNLNQVTLKLSDNIT